MAFVNEPPAGGFFCGVVVPTFGKNHFDRTGCAWHGISWMFESIFALHGVWFGFLSLSNFGWGSKFSKQLLRPPLTQRFSSQLVRILNFSPSSFQPKILWVLVSSPRKPWVLCFGESPFVPWRGAWCPWLCRHGGAWWFLTSTKCLVPPWHKWSMHQASCDLHRVNHRWMADPGRMEWKGRGRNLWRNLVFWTNGWKHHLTTFQCSVCLGIFFLRGPLCLFGVSHPWVRGPCLQDTQQQIGDAPYQGPLLFRPPNKRRTTQGLEEFPVFCWGGLPAGIFFTLIWWKHVSYE